MARRKAWGYLQVPAVKVPLLPASSRVVSQPRISDCIQPEAETASHASDSAARVPSPIRTARKVYTLFGPSPKRREAGYAMRAWRRR